LQVNTAGTASVCPGFSTVISAAAFDGQGSGYTYIWTPSTGLNNDTLAAPTATPAISTTYTVTAGDGCSPTVTSTVTVTVLPLPVPVIHSIVTSGCKPVCVNFTESSTISSGSINGWSWNFGDATPPVVQGLGQTPSHCYMTAGTYTVTLTDTSAAGCISISTVPYLITVYPDPVADYSAPLSTSIVTPEVQFTDLSTTSSGTIVTWDWAFNDPFSTAFNDSSAIQYPLHEFSQAGTYCGELIVKNSLGCKDTTSMCIVIDPEFTFYIPNAFSPNGDGINDEFYGKGDFITAFEMSIYDRWGNLIFHTDDINMHWDGKANHGSEVSQEDVYVYLVKLSDNKDKKHKYLGSVTIVK
jgi:gliding motility-associated-like protein